MLEARTQLLSLLLLAVTVNNCGSATSANLKGIDGERALEHAQAIAEIGPHPAGSSAQRKAGLYLIEQLKSYGLRVQTHAFSALTPLGPREMVNIWGILPGQTSSVILLASHYDSKHFEEFRFVGANDSGSSCGIVLELARVLAGRGSSRFTFWFVFFDGEEAFREWTDRDSLYGSREFVRRLRRQGQIQDIRALILLDLVGGKELRLYQDQNSTPWLRGLIWSKAAELGRTELFRPTGTTVAIDDHIPFADAGISVVDIIDLEYAHWHTAEDTADKLSAENMEIVGNVVLASLPEIEDHLEK